MPYASIPMSVVGCAEHRQLAYEAAVKSVVLLKNRDDILPIAPSVRRILVIGPNAAAASAAGQLLRLQRIPGHPAGGHHRPVPGRDGHGISPGLR